MFALLGTVAFAAALIGLFFWAPWENPTEVEWLVAYETWSDGMEGTLAAGGSPRRTLCESTYDEEVGNPPTERLEPVSIVARGGCATLSPEGWQATQSKLVRGLMAIHGVLEQPRSRPDYAEIAESSVGVRAKVLCWRPSAWATFSEHYGILRAGEEIWLKGVADTARNRIDLEPGVCAALGRYLRRIRPPDLSHQNLELAEALIVLTHEAEHLKAPSASEADVECYAVQHVRPLVRAGGWGPEFATEIALHAWDLAYTQLPAHFRTPSCRNDGPLDRNPQSTLWP